MFNLAASDAKHNSPAATDIGAGFEEVPAASWIEVDINTFIRYKKNDGTIVRGGYVMSKSYDKHTLILRSDIKDPNSMQWQVKLDSITNLWKKVKVDEDTALIARMLKALNDRIVSLEQIDNGDSAQLRTEIVELTARINSIEINIQKLFDYLTSLREFIAETAT